MSLMMITSQTTWATARAPERITAARIVAAARAQIDARLDSERGAAQVTVVGTPEDVMVPKGTVTLGLRPLAGRWPRARVGVPVEISVDGQVVRSATVWFAIDLHRQVLGYAVDAPIGASAASLKLVPCDVDVAAVQGAIVREQHDLQGMRLRHAVLAGSVAVREDFERMPDVDRQGRVQVLVALGSIHMQAHGTAMARGYIGDTISVLVDNAEAPVQARVTDRGVVEIVQ